jgi:cytochrome c553
MAGQIIRNVVAGVMAAIFGVLLGIAAARAEDIEQKAQVCGLCHGGNGVPVLKTIPIIWGQNQGYLYLQLRDMKRGTREVAEMANVLEPLSRDDMMGLAEYFSKKKWPDLQQPRARESVAQQALTANSSIGCTGCHLSGFRAAGSVPRLAGQQREYLDKATSDFRSKVRANNPGMTDLMSISSPTDLAALAEYLAGL